MLASLLSQLGTGPAESPPGFQQAESRLNNAAIGQRPCPVCVLRLAGGLDFFFGPVLGGNGLGLEGELFGAHLFVGGDVVLVLQRQIDVVVAVHQTPTHVIVHLERAGSRHRK